VDTWHISDGRFEAELLIDEGAAIVQKKKNSDRPLAQDWPKPERCGEGDLVCRWSWLPVASKNASSTKRDVNGRGRGVSLGVGACCYFGASPFTVEEAIEAGRTASAAD
jgi:hypothetical protein